MSGVVNTVQAKTSAIKTSGTYRAGLLEKVEGNGLLDEQQNKSLTNLDTNCSQWGMCQQKGWGRKKNL